MGLTIGVPIAVLAAVIPAVVWALFVWWCDRYEHEPAGLVVATFLWGAVPAIFLSLVAEGATGASLRFLTGGTSSQLLEIGLIAPAVEEAAKGLAILGVFLLVRMEFDNLLDGIVYGTLVGFGFAMTENFFYYVGTAVEDGFTSLTFIFVLRSIVFGLNHAFYTAFTGAGFGLARLAKPGIRRVLYPVMGLAVAISFHAIHNFGISLTDRSIVAIFISLFSALTGVITVVVLVLLAWRQERKWITSEISEEVGSLVTAEEYDVIVVYLRQWHNWWRKRTVRSDHQLHTLVAELAFKKHQLRRLGGKQDSKTSAKISHLRKQIAALRAESG